MRTKQEVRKEIKKAKAEMAKRTYGSKEYQEATAVFWELQKELGQIELKEAGIL